MLRMPHMRSHIFMHAKIKNTNTGTLYLMTYRSSAKCWSYQWIANRQQATPKRGTIYQNWRLKNVRTCEIPWDRWDSNIPTRQSMTRLLFQPSDTPRSICQMLRWKHWHFRPYGTPDSSGKRARHDGIKFRKCPYRICDFLAVEFQKPLFYAGHKIF